MKFFLIAGERSGDLHGSNLIRELSNLEPSSQIAGYGGDQMEEAGMQLKMHYSTFSIMGFVEVLYKYSTIRKCIKQAQQDVLEYKPDALILIDFGGFNMRVAKFAKANGIRVVYYIPPKVWAWNTGRARKLKAIVDQLLCILPFEPAFYKQFDWNVQYVGNPVNDAIRNYLNSQPATIEDLPKKKIIALLPGSRNQELKKINPLLEEVIRQLPDFHFLVAGISSVEREYYKQLAQLENVSLIMDRTYDLVRSSHAAIVCSGTATLETALLNVPQLVVYKANSISYLIGKQVVKVDHISLVNLILDRGLVQEFIQGEAQADNVISELKLITSDIKRRREIFNGYEELKDRLGQDSASYNAARSIIEELPV